MAKKSLKGIVCFSIFALFLISFFGWTIAARAGGDPALLDRTKQVAPEILRDMEVLVNIDSPSDYGAGIAKVQDFVADKLKLLGARIETFPGPKGAYNITATFEGTGKGRILLMAHADTVFKQGTAAQNPFRIADGRAYGPGVVDDRAGILAGLYALRILNERGFRDFAKITFLINCDEEVGSGSSKELIMKLGKEHDYAICLEGGRPGDGIVGSRKGTARMIVEVKGRASHAGNAPYQGANALVELAHQVLQLSKLADKEKGTSVSFTIFKAGDKLNVIPDHAEARADVRVPTVQEFNRLDQGAKEIIKNKVVPDAEVKLSFTAGRPPYPSTPKGDALIAKAQNVYQEIGGHFKVEFSGGGSDGNYTAFVGAPTIDGMAFEGGNGHTDKEYLEIGSLSPRLYLLARLLMELGSQK